MAPVCTASQINLLIYHYLKESGFHHSCFSLRHESRLDEEPLSKEAVIEPGQLVKVLQKGLLYLAVEAHVNPDGSEKPCSAAFSLVGPAHVCDGQPRPTPSKETTPVPRKLTPSPPPAEVSTRKEMSVQTQADRVGGGGESSRKSTSRASSMGAPSPGTLAKVNGLHPGTAEAGTGTGTGSTAAEEAVASTSTSSQLASSKTKLDADSPRETTPGPSSSKRKTAKSGGGASRNEKRARRDTTEEASGSARGINGRGSVPNAASGEEEDNAAAEGDEEEDDAPTPRSGSNGHGNGGRNGKGPGGGKGKTAAAAQASAVDEVRGPAGKKKKKKKNASDESSAANASPSAALKESKAAKAAEANRIPTLSAVAKSKEVADTDVFRFRGHSAEVFLSAWNPTVPGLLATGAGDATVRIWDLGSAIIAEADGVESAVDAAPPPAVCKHLPATHSKDVSALSWNPDGTLLASGSYDGILRLWTPQGDLHLVMSMHQGPIFGVRWNRKGNLILTGSADGTAIVWDLGSGKVRQQYSLHSDSVLDIDWMTGSMSDSQPGMGDDATFATCSADNSVNILRIGETKPVKTLRGHDDEVNAIRFDPTGSLLASVSDDMTARIWSMDAILASSSASGVASSLSDVKVSKRERSTPRPSARGGSADMDVDEESTTQATDATAAAASSSTSHIQAESQDAVNGSSSSSSLAASAAGSNRSELCRHVLKGHTKEIYAVAWAPKRSDGGPRLLATASFDATARIWNADNGSCLRVVDQHTDSVYSVCFSPDARFLVTGGMDHRLFVTSVADGSLVKAYAGTGGIFDVTWHVQRTSGQDDQVKSGSGAPMQEEEEEQKPQQSDQAPNQSQEEKRGSLSSSNKQHLALSQADRTLVVLDVSDLASS
ncbi:WD40 repeat-like protein [Acaromyces ingoldii]|uniref:WD40 repeat-like protein n=1 Tax=Acaromyces ingoldii TaxID=215250 RepID=A0A316YPK5_9BASI|nr:WD40 repeat-like protein [Acaromyces ingoldii]PWN89675.1 WD40 repeat-like protein [Acaromyces ingoldii]